MYPNSMPDFIIKYVVDIFSFLYKMPKSETGDTLGAGVVRSGWGDLEVIVVRVFESVFQNLPQPYTWPLKKTDPFIY